MSLRYASTVLMGYFAETAIHFGLWRGNIPQAEIVATDFARSTPETLRVVNLGLLVIVMESAIILIGVCVLIAELLFIHPKSSKYVVCSICIVCLTFVNSLVFRDSSLSQAARELASRVARDANPILPNISTAMEQNEAEFSVAQMRFKRTRGNRYLCSADAKSKDTNLGKIFSCEYGGRGRIEWIGFDISEFYSRYLIVWSNATDSGDGSDWRNHAPTIELSGFKIVRMQPLAEKSWWLVEYQ